jgi:hypothetical protein
MVLKGYRLWVMGQLDSNVQSPNKLNPVDPLLESNWFQPFSV